MKTHRNQNVPQQEPCQELAKLMQRILADISELHGRCETPEERHLAARAGTAIVALRDLVRGAEPYWMQDIRLAQRRIDAQRPSRARPHESEGKEG